MIWQRIIRLTAVILLLGLLLSSEVMAYSNNKGIGKIQVKATPVHIMRDGKKIAIGSFGMVLNQGDEIVTGLTGKAHVSLDGNNNIYLGPFLQTKSKSAINSKK